MATVPLGRVAVENPKIRVRRTIRGSRAREIVDSRPIFVVSLIMFELMTLRMGASAVPHDFHSPYVRACLRVCVRACVPVDSYAGNVAKRRRNWER